MRIVAVDIVGFFNDLTGGHLLAWKTAVASLIVALAGLQVALAGRFWAGRGLRLDADLAANFHRWNGRALLVLSLGLGYVCLLVQAGPTSPLRILLHSIFGATLFVLLGAKMAVLHVVKERRSWLPALGIALFANYVVLWVLSAVDYASNATDPKPGVVLQVGVTVAGVAMVALGGVGLWAFARRGGQPPTGDVPA